MPDRFTPIPAGTDQAQANNLINKNFAQLDQEGTVKLYTGADGIPSILIDGTIPVIKVAEPGVDVTQATDDQLNFNSGQNVFKIVASGTLIIPAASLDTGGANYAVGNAETVQTPHNLGYVPAILAFWTDGSGFYVPLSWTTSAQWGAGGFTFVETTCVATDTDVHASQIMYGYNVNTTNPAASIKYYLLQETAN